MIRRTIRVGIRLGLLTGVGLALFKLLQGRRSATELGSPSADWAPAPRPNPNLPKTPPEPELVTPVMLEEVIEKKAAVAAAPAPPEVTIEAPPASPAPPEVTIEAPEVTIEAPPAPPTLPAAKKVGPAKKAAAKKAAPPAAAGAVKKVAPPKKAAPLAAEAPAPAPAKKAGPVKKAPRKQQP